MENGSLIKAVTASHSPSVIPHAPSLVGYKIASSAIHDLQRREIADILYQQAQTKPTV